MQPACAGVALAAICRSFYLPIARAFARMTGRSHALCVAVAALLGAAAALECSRSCVLPRAAAFCGPALKFDVCVGAGGREGGVTELDAQAHAAFDAVVASSSTPIPPTSA